MTSVTTIAYGTLASQEVMSLPTNIVHCYYNQNLRKLPH